MNAYQQRLGDSVDNSLGALKQLRPMPPAIARNAEQLQIAYDAFQSRVMEQHAARQLTGQHGHSLTLLRQDLRRKHLLPIVRHGRSLLAGLPGIREDLRLPRVRMSDAEWVESARRIAKAVRPHRKVFLAAHFPSDFLQRLDAAARALHARSRTGNAQINRMSLATRAIGDDLRRCRELVAMIDSLVAADDSISAIWKELWRQSTRIPKRIGRPKKKRQRRARTAAT